MAVEPFQHRDPEDWDRFMRGLPPRPKAPPIPGQASPMRSPALARPLAGDPFETLGGMPRPDTGPAAAPSTAAVDAAVQNAKTPSAPVAPAAEEPAAPLPSANNGTARMLDALFSGLAGKGYDSQYWQGLDDRAVKQQQLERQKQLMDPASAASQQSRARMAPVLRNLGLQDDEIAMLSGADLEQMSKGGDLVTSLANMRAKAQAAKDALTAKRADEDAKAKAAAAEWDRQNAITAPQALERARAVGGMATGRMIQGALLQDELHQSAEERADQRKKEAEAREAARRASAQGAKDARDAENKLINEELALDKLEKKLAARDPNDSLPGQGNVVERALIKGKANIAGGSGMSPEDTGLDTDLTATGLAAYMNTAGNAPNSEREQAVANQLFRGNGTYGSALQRVRERKAEIARKKAAMKQRVPTAAAVEVPPPEGDDWEISQ